MSLRVEWPMAGVAELIMDRPEALNAISTEQARALIMATSSLAEDPQLRVVLLTSALPTAFCVGADLKERNGFTDEQLLAQRPIMQAAFAGVRDLGVPTIAVVEGFALGGGCELALSCDLIYASDQAWLGLPEVRVGLVPGGGGTQLLTRRIGPSRAAELIMTGRRVDGVEAEQMGLIDRLAEHGQTSSAALETAELIMESSPLAVRLARHAMRKGADLELERGLAVEHAAWLEAAMSDDRREGIAAFSEKRAPQWRR